MANTNERFRSLDRRHRRVRKKVVGTAERPRLAVYRSNKHIYAQVIDDFAGRTLAASSTTAGNGDGAPKERAKKVGLDLASKAKAAGVTQVTFDRGGFRYHGRVQAVAEGAREGGLEF
ncbi:MAG: 50S ribosomal protein L18 [Actinomycetota bacterium]